ncbi:hypothetical protein [Pendulispora albinea]|uniref:Uncharacterized protein n=1 Tax=Pendulispora albinea TaxID=2741071 RepID=A0ABZ2M1Z6_9BACT
MMSRVTLLALTTTFFLGLGACGGSSAPPPKTEEVPINTESARREAKRPDPEVGEDVTQAAAPPAAASPPPAAEPSAPSAPATASSGKGSGGKTSKGTAAASSGSGGGARGGKGELSKAECDQLMDRYIDVVVTGDGAPLKGMSGKELEQARGMIKATVAQDPNFVGFKSACYRDLSKAQFACAMKARATEEFQNCIR